ncbi:MAG: hypothetical protein WCP57_05985 [Bacteroidota bacterium]
MLLHIKPSDTIQEVQNKFKSLFSHLKPEFFKKFHSESDGYAKKEEYMHNITMAEITGHQEALEIHIDAHMSTEAFEKMFEEKYHLHVQLMRLQKDSWLITTNSQELSLNDQNARGIAADEEMAPEMLKDFDAE